jgi:hypothetical protein
MAATWKVTVVLTNPAAGTASVTATRTDGEDVRTYSLAKVSTDTAKTAAGDITGRIVESIRKMFLVDEAQRAATQAVTNKWDAALAEALNAEER